VQTPLIDLTYADIVRLGERYRVPLQKTWSCRRGREQPCDHCFSCRQRARAFLQAGIVDTAALAGAGRND
jgi:7-cyano-7-deazaguanine synthase